MLNKYIRRQKRKEYERKRDEEWQAELKTYWIVIGYNLPKYLAPFKYAGTDEESQRKYKDMLKQIDNSKHELHLYKELEQSIDTERTELAGPTFKDTQNFKLYDFRDLNGNEQKQKPSYSESPVNLSDINVEGYVPTPIIKYQQQLNKIWASTADELPPEISLSHKDIVKSDSELSSENSSLCDIETPDIFEKDRKYGRGKLNTSGRLKNDIETS